MATWVLWAYIKRESGRCHAVLARLLFQVRIRARPRVPAARRPKEVFFFPRGTFHCALGVHSSFCFKLLSPSRATV